MQHEDILRTYEDLHKLAEPSGKEQNTSAYLRGRLEAAGFALRTFPDHHGFYAELSGETNAVIALRADMDALLQEVDGEVRPNHACGHDAHSTMVLHTALRAVESGHSYHHTLRFIFQPAEEIAAGALQMLKGGALDDVRFLGGIHLRPAKEVPNKKAAPVILHGSIVTLKAVVRGVPAHAARPEFANNPIEAGTRLLEALKQVHIDRPYSFKVTEFHAGEASNAIPEKARLTFDARAAETGTLDDIMKQAETLMRQVALDTKTDIEWEWVEFSPAAVKHEQAVALAEKAIGVAVSDDAVVPPCVSPGAEDFHFYTHHQKGLPATMIGLGCGLEPGLHHPKMTFDTSAIFTGVDILEALLLEADHVTWEGK
ncbi:UNVERIFIED_CONTAM: amidohydrolase [Halobacillus marinus]